MALVPRGKRGSPKESQKQKFAEWLLWLRGRAAVKCSSACRAAGQHVYITMQQGGVGRTGAEKKEASGDWQQGRNSRAAQGPEQASVHRVSDPLGASSPHPGHPRCPIPSSAALTSLRPHSAPSSTSSLPLTSPSHTLSLPPFKCPHMAILQIRCSERHESCRN